VRHLAKVADFTWRCGSVKLHSTGTGCLAEKKHGPAFSLSGPVSFKQGVVVAASGLIKALYLTRFSKPASDRVLYRAVAQQRPQRMLLLGLGSGERAVRLIELAQRYADTDEIAVTGVDLFEGRPSEATTQLSLKDAHRRMRDTGAQVQLVPGDPYSALARCANSLPNIDMLLVDADQDTDSLAQAWFYAPRMLHDATLVLVEHEQGVDEKSGRRISQYDRLDRVTIEQMASRVRVRRAA
jgi:hypothetical protein